MRTSFHSSLRWTTGALSSWVMAVASRSCKSAMSLWLPSTLPCTPRRRSARNGSHGWCRRAASAITSYRVAPLPGGTTTRGCTR